jgi:hypothetical protein
MIATFIKGAGLEDGCRERSSQPCQRFNKGLPIAMVPDIVVFSGAHTWGVRLLELKYGSGSNISSRSAWRCAHFGAKSTINYRNPP